ncbi:hypothetical protein RQP46_007904 [Phenoliferia psychrophenolica]
MPLPPTLVVGRGRAYGLQIISHLSSHLSITGLSVIFPFSPSHLALALRTLHPPARVITIGGAYSDDEADQARGVWEEYRKEVEEKPEEYGEEDKGVKTCFVRVKGVKEGGAAAITGEAENCMSLRTTGDHSEARLGQNPFAARSIALDRLLYGPPTKGFTVRIGFYLVLIFSGIFFCLVLTGLVIYDRRRQQTSERLWIFKRAKRGEGTWIITNIKLLVPLGLIAGMLGGLVFTGIAYKVFKYHGPQNVIGGWRMGMTLPFHVGGWMLSYGSLSSYLITRSGNPHWILTPRVINTFFIGLGVAGTLAQLGLVIYEGRLWAATFTLWQDAIAELGPLAGRWDMGEQIDVAGFDSGIYFQFSHSIDRFQMRVSFCAVTYGIMMGYAFMIINFCFLALIFTVRRQIAMKVSGIGSHHWTSSTTESSKSTSSIPTKQRKQSISRSAVRELASSDAVASAAQQARDIQGLQRAELDLAIVAMMVVIIGIGGFGVYVKLVILCATKTYFRQIWPVTELVLFTPVWGWAGATGLIVPLLILNTWFNMPGTLPGQRRPTLTPRTSSQGGPLATAVEEDLEARLEGTLALPDRIN